MPTTANETAYQRRPRDIAFLLQRLVRYAAVLQLEKVTRPIPQSKEDIPINFAAVTPEWLEVVLCADVSGAKVEGVERGVGHVGTTGRQQYKISYNSVGRSAGCPTSIFAKGTPTLMTRVAMSVIPSCRAEAEFYQLVRPLVEMEAPVGYFSNYDLRSGRTIHLIEDLVATKGARFPEPADRLTRAHAESLVLNLAKYHGRFFAAPELKTQLAGRPHWTTTCRHMVRVANLGHFHLKGLEKGRHFLPERIIDRAKDTWLGALLSADDHLRYPSTMLHCDPHLRNWYITDTEEMGLLDWQIVTQGYWMRDLAYALSSCLTIEQRRDWEEDLITLYLRDLNSRTGQSIDMKDVWNDYLRQIFSALAFWTVTYAPPDGTPDNMQPEHVSEEMLKRFCAAIDDHDGFSAFEALR